MNIKPFGKRILIKPVEKQTILNVDEGALSEYGDVIAIGDEVKKIKVGDKIGFSVFGVEKLVIDEQKYYFILESDEFLLGKIEQ